MGGSTLTPCRLRRPKWPEAGSLAFVLSLGWGGCCPLSNTTALRCPGRCWHFVICWSVRTSRQIVGPPASLFVCVCVCEGGDFARGLSAAQDLSSSQAPCSRTFWMDIEYPRWVFGSSGHVLCCTDICEGTAPSSSAGIRSSGIVC